MISKHSLHFAMRCFLVTLLKAHSTKWPEKLPNCTGMEKAWEITRVTVSRKYPLKKFEKEIEEINKNCRKEVELKEDFILFGMKKAFAGS